METLAQPCGRIIAALEDLIAQESAALTHGDWPGVLALQDRIAPLVDFLTSTGSGGSAGPELRSQILALHARRNQTSVALAQEIERTRNELQQTRVIRRRVAQIAPAYGHASATRHRLQAVG